MNYVKALKNDIQLQNIVSITGLGTLIHWYCFYILSAQLEFIFTNKLDQIYDKGIALSWAALLFGFLVRPLASIVLSPKIDTEGRRNTLTVSMNILAFSLLIVVVFPFEHLPGYLGASAIFLSRILQGIAISIEYGAAITYVYETVPKNKTGFFTGVIQATAPLGFLSAMVVLFLTKQTFTEELYNNYFWRFPLFIGAILFFFSYKIRNELPESPAFSKVKSRLEVVANPLKEVFQKENLKKMIFAVFALCGVQGVTYYFSHSFIRILLESYFQASHSTSLFFLISIITLIWPIGLIVAHKSDSVGTRKLLTILLTLLLIFFPIFINIISGYNKADSIWIAFGPVAIIYALSIALYSITGKFLADLFPEQIRGTGISIPYHIGNGVFGGLITLIANIKTVNNENYDFVIGYILVTILISLMVNLFFFKNRA